MAEAVAVQLSSPALDVDETSRRVEDFLRGAGLTVERGRSIKDAAELYAYWARFNPYLGVSVFVERDDKNPDILKLSLSERCYVKFPLTDIVTDSRTRVHDSEGLIDLGMGFEDLHEYAKTHGYYLSDINDQTIFFSCGDILFFTNTIYALLNNTALLSS